MLGLAKKLTVTDANGRKTQSDIAFDTWWGYAITYIWQNGGRVWKEDFSACTIDEPAAYDAIQWWAELMNKHNVAPQVAELTEQDTTADAMFTAGKVAMMITGRYQVPAFRNGIGSFAWDVSYLPMGKVRANMMTSGQYSVSSNSHHKEEAWTYIRFMSTSEEAQALRSMEGAAMPPLLSLMKTDYFLAPGKSPSCAQVFQDELDWTQPMRGFPHGLEFVDALEQILDPIWNGTQSAKDAMTAGKARLAAILTRQ